MPASAARSTRIALRGLRATGYHGYFDWERQRGQEFVVDVVLWADLERAQRSDELVDTIDYGAVAERVAAIVTGAPYRLIEALAGRIADEVLTAGGQRVEVTVHKPEAPIEVGFDDVSVTVSRERAG
ncbi:dihydroneopterin aldolase [Haloechinothrix sp. LS1_15]|nr:dihydroneopterin aldolase [Haloechinothrix sp. LS1_15]